MSIDHGGSGERKKIDITATVDKHKTFVPQFLKAHAISVATQLHTFMVMEREK